MRPMWRSAAVALAMSAAAMPGTAHAQRSVQDITALNAVQFDGRIIGAALANDVAGSGNLLNWKDCSYYIFPDGTGTWMNAARGKRAFAGGEAKACLYVAVGQHQEFKEYFLKPEKCSSGVDSSCFGGYRIDGMMETSIRSFSYQEDIQVEVTREFYGFVTSFTLSGGGDRNRPGRYRRDEVRPVILRQHVMTGVTQFVANAREHGYIETVFSPNAFFAARPTVHLSPTYHAFSLGAACKTIVGMAADTYREGTEALRTLNKDAQFALGSIFGGLIGGRLGGDKGMMVGGVSGGFLGQSNAELSNFVLRVSSNAIADAGEYVGKNVMCAMAADARVPSPRLPTFPLDPDISGPMTILRGCYRCTRTETQTIRPPGEIDENGTVIVHEPIHTTTCVSRQFDMHGDDTDGDGYCN